MTDGKISEVQPRYPVKFGKRSSHVRIRELLSDLPVGRVLDVGCARGELLIELDNQGWECVGVEIDTQDAHVARAKGLDVSTERIEHFIELVEGNFDCIVLADVLEHLRDPSDVLGRLKPLLSEHGLILISVPNVAHVTVRLQLLLGRFQYSDRGIMDRTHLRFFTRRSLIEMLEREGFVIEHEEFTAPPIEQIVNYSETSSIWRLAAAINNAMPSISRSLFAYQVLVLVKACSK